MGPTNGPVIVDVRVTFTSPNPAKDRIEGKASLSHWPRTVKDSDGYRVSISNPGGNVPVRWVSLYVSGTRCSIEAVR
ncbi:hypothetical protein H4V95_001507 [Arthrobacter sp. CAN_C5]|nr:hypothetical protein [Arthrobacter sp. CAN_C5]